MAEMFPDGNAMGGDQLTSAEVKVDKQTVEYLEEMTKRALSAFINSHEIHKNAESINDIVFKVSSEKKPGTKLLVHNVEVKENSGRYQYWTLSYDDGKTNAGAFKRFGTITEDGNFHPHSWYLEPGSEFPQHVNCSVEVVDQCISDFYNDGEFMLEKITPHFYQTPQEKYLEYFRLAMQANAETDLIET